MAVWAYVCRSCDDEAAVSWYAAAVQVAEMPAQTRIVRLKVGAQWRCAVLDRSQRVSVEQMLVREAIASSEEDCPACGARLLQREQSAADSSGEEEQPSPNLDTAAERAAAAKPPAASATVQAAAISLQGMPLVVVLVSLGVVHCAGEADMAIDALAPRFGAVPVVLMAQEEDGSPRYYGDDELVRLLDGIPLDRMPWQEYPVG